MKLTEVQVASVLGALAAGGEMALAARIVGISRSSLYNACKADPELKEKIDEARAQADEVVIKSLYTKATQEKDTTAMIFWLKNRRPQEWRDRRDIDLRAEVVDVRDVIREAYKGAQVNTEERTN